MPTFLDEVWFEKHSAEAEQHQRCFIDIDTGSSVRDLDLPVRFTRRMAHLFMRQRNRDSIAYNLRWAQVLGKVVIITWRARF